MDNFNKVCGIILAMLVLLSVCFTIKANAEEYVPAESADNSAQADQSADGEVHEVTQVTGVQVNDPTLYEKLDKLQDSVDALAAALAPSVDAESGAEENPAPDYTAQLSDISAQLVQLNSTATAETAETDAFSKPFEDYSVTEVLLLVLATIAVGAIIINFVYRL